MTHIDAAEPQSEPQSQCQSRDLNRCRIQLSDKRGSGLMGAGQMGRIPKGKLRGGSACNVLRLTRSAYELNRKVN